MIGRIKNKYLRRTLLILSTPFVAILLILCDMCISFIYSCKELKDAFIEAWGN